MLYQVYEEYKNKYYEAQKIFNDILNEQESLFVRTQPKATRADKEIVSGGSISNTFDTYLIKKEEKQIEARLEEARSILKDREKLLKLKEVELRISKDWLDIIYIYYYIEKMSIRQIEKKIKYKYDYPICKSEIHRKLKIIRKNINLEQKGTKTRLQ